MLEFIRIVASFMVVFAPADSTHYSPPRLCSCAYSDAEMVWQISQRSKKYDKSLFR